MKKKILFLAALVLICAILATGTLAYFTTRAVMHNVITTNGISIDLVEKMLDDDDLVPWEDQEGVMPGMDVSKIVWVENREADAFIRVKVDVSATAADGTPLDPDFLTIDYDAENWTLRGGWYYYNDPVPQGGKTTVLFDKVIFDGPKMDNSYQNATIEIEVSAQAVQAANNGHSALNASGWPIN